MEKNNGIVLYYIMCRLELVSDIISNVMEPAIIDNKICIYCLYLKCLSHIKVGVTTYNHLKDITISIRGILKMTTCIIPTYYLKMRDQSGFVNLSKLSTSNEGQHWEPTCSNDYMNDNMDTIVSLVHHD